MTRAAVAAVVCVAALAAAGCGGGDGGGGSDRVVTAAQARACLKQAGAEILDSAPGSSLFGDSSRGSFQADVDGAVELAFAADEKEAKRTAELARGMLRATGMDDSDARSVGSVAYWPLNDGADVTLAVVGRCVS